MKISEVRELNADELTQRLQGFKRQLLDFRMQKAEGKLATPHRIQEVRRDVARILTVLKEKKP